MDEARRKELEAPLKPRLVCTLGEARGEARGERRPDEEDRETDRLAGTAMERRGLFASAALLWMPRLVPEGFCTTVTELWVLAMEVGEVATGGVLAVVVTVVPAETGES